MITKKEYLKAKKVVDAYTKQLNKPVVNGRFLIRVEKASKSSFWYSPRHENAIGKTFKVKDDDQDWEIVPYVGKYIDKRDAVVLKTCR